MFKKIFLTILLIFCLASSAWSAGKVNYHEADINVVLNEVFNKQADFTKVTVSSTLGVTGTSTLGAVTSTGITADLTGNVTGNLTGNVTGNLNGIVGGTTPAAGSFTALSASTGYNGAVGGVTPAAGAFTTITASDNITMGTAAKGLVLKQGANGKCGTFVANEATPVTVANTSVAITDTIIISLNTVGGTVGALPHLATITAGTGFTVVATAGDTSTYNYAIISNAQ